MINVVYSNNIYDYLVNTDNNPKYLTVAPFLKKETNIKTNKPSFLCRMTTGDLKGYPLFIEDEEEIKRLQGIYLEREDILKIKVNKEFDITLLNDKVIDIILNQVDEISKMIDNNYIVKFKEDKYYYHVQITDSSFTTIKQLESSMFIANEKVVNCANYIYNALKKSKSRRYDFIEDYNKRMIDDKEIDCFIAYKIINTSENNDDRKRTLLSFCIDLDGKIISPIHSSINNEIYNIKDEKNNYSNLCNEILAEMKKENRLIKCKRKRKFAYKEK